MHHVCQFYHDEMECLGGRNAPYSIALDVAFVHSHYPFSHVKFDMDDASLMSCCTMSGYFKCIRVVFRDFSRTFSLLLNY